MSERAPVADKTERVILRADAPNNFSKMRVKRGFTSGEAQVLQFALLAVAQNFFNDVQREIAGSRVPLVETMPAPEVASVGQFDNDPRHSSPSGYAAASKRNSVAGLW